jgi:hydroxymethylbilane synthase
MRNMIILGSRGSDLALWQAHHVQAMLAERAALSVEIKIIKTAGDRISEVSLASLPGKGFFTKEIEAALLAGEIDLAVHSHKDLPTESPDGLTVAAVPERGAAGECLVIAPAAWVADELLPLSTGAVVGTGSARRAVQLRALRSDLEIRDLRGNVPTRIRKVADGRYDAIVLARAGIDRLELDPAPLQVWDLDPAVFVPAPAQGALAIQVRSGDRLLEKDNQWQHALTSIHHRPTARAVLTERLVLAALEGGCQLPLGAHATLDGEKIELLAALGYEDGSLRRCLVGGDTPEAAAQAALKILTT